MASVFDAVQRVVSDIRETVEVAREVSRYRGAISTAARDVSHAHHIFVVHRGGEVFPIERDYYVTTMLPRFAMHPESRPHVADWLTAAKRSPPAGYVTCIIPAGDDGCRFVDVLVEKRP